MKVIINGNEELAIPESARTLNDALTALVEYLHSKKLGLVKLRVNEQDVYPGDSLNSVQNMNILNIHKLEATAVPILQLLKESITDLEKYTPELSSICYAIADLFQSENPNDGLIPFQKLTEIWGEVKNREAVIVNTVSRYLDKENSIVNEIVIHHNELNQFLNEAYNALEKGDIVSLSDILQYELAPRAEKEVNIVNILKQLVNIAEARGHIE